MQIVGRIGIPKSVEVANLYLQCNDKTAIDYGAEPEVTFVQQGVISTNSYFNSWYETFYSKYTTLEKVYCLLQLEGDFQVSVYRELQDSSTRQLISSEKLLNCQLDEPVKIVLPDLQNSQAVLGRIYFELSCLSDSGRFRESLVVTPQPPKEVSLAIIACTFKKEAFVKRTVETILQDKLLANKQVKTYVIDNGSTLSEVDFPNEAVELIRNRNFGGSGGFTRGIIEAIRSDRYSHLLLLDDDIDLESESIYRIVTLYEYSKAELAIAGSMLDLQKKCMLYESGALYNKTQEQKFQPFNIVRLNHNLDLQNSSNLNLLLREDNIDSAGFYFFAVSKKMVESIGLLLPLFIKVDDTEFCLRIKAKFGREAIVAFPGIATWHETFFSKSALWDYYYYRNDLIAQAIHGSLKYVNAIAHFTKPIIFSLLVFDYRNAEMLIKAFEDYLQGTTIIKSNDPEEWHARIVTLSKNYPTQSVQQNYSPNPQDSALKSTTNWLKKILSLLTLNGHFLPSYFIQDEAVLLWQKPQFADRISRALGKKRVLIFKEGDTCLYKNEIDKPTGIKLLWRWLKLVVESRFKWTQVSKEWQLSVRELTSINFWQQYLGLEPHKCNLK